MSLVKRWNGAEPGISGQTWGSKPSPRYAASSAPLGASESLLLDHG